MSGDGRWWWDGERWLAAVTPDGLWQWDGERWRPTIELRGVRPRDLATTLALLAEDRYAHAAAILVERAREWRPRDELRDLVQQASGLRRRLVRALAGPEEALLDTQYRALMVRLGRRAPRPTVKEADDMLDVARALDRRAARITEALAAADQAELARVQAIDDARRELMAAEAARREAVEAAALAQARTRQAREAERRAARGRFRSALEGPAGQPLAQVGPLLAYAGYLDTPAGRLPADGARAWVASAVALWRQHRDLIADVLAADIPEASEFLRCLTERRRDLFLLLDCRSRTVLWRCPAGEEKPLRRFVTAVNRQAGPAAGVAADRLRAADALLGELRPAGARAPGPADGPDVEQELMSAVQAARERLAEARQEPPALVAARRQAAAETAAIATPPEPLRPNMTEAHSTSGLRRSGPG